MDFLIKMKKQNGFSQIVIMVVMLIMAIALPITANLVKKVQDNRSSAKNCGFVSYGDGFFYPPNDSTFCSSGDFGRLNELSECNSGSIKYISRCSGGCVYTKAPILTSDFGAINETYSGSSTARCRDDLECTNKGGSCNAASDAKNGTACTTSSTKSGKVETGLCWTTLTKTCCVPDSPSTPAKTPVATCVPDNSCIANTLVGQTCTNNCGQVLSGVKPAPAKTSTPISTGGTPGTNTGGVFTAVNAAPGTVKTSKLGSYGAEFDTDVCENMGGYCNYYQSAPSAGTTCVGINYSDSGIVVGKIYTGKCLNYTTSRLAALGLTSGQIRCCSGSTTAVSQPVTVVTSTPGCTATTGTNGSCGAAAGTMHWTDGTAPTTTNLITQNPLCANGSPSTVTTNADYTYTWTCGGGAGTCTGATGSSANCTAYWLNCNDLNYWAMYPDVKDAGWRPYLHYTTVHASEPGRTWPTSGSTPFCWEGTKKITCGNVETGPNDTCGTKPAPIVCTPNSCAANTLVGQTCDDDCGGKQNGTKPAPVCTSGDKQCSGDNAQICRADGSDWTNTDCGTLGCNATIKVCNVCTPGAKRCLNTGTTQTCISNAWENNVPCGSLGCNSTTGVCNTCVTNNQRCGDTNDYYTCKNDGIEDWGSYSTNCPSGKVCTDGEIGTAVCKDPDYTAPKLNMFFAISGVKKIDNCFGDIKFKVSITKNGSSVATTSEITATVVDNKFNTKFGDQVFKITDFALTNDYALTDKIKITVGSSRKILATIYGKDNQASGFPALNNSTILVSDLVGNTLNFYDYPVLNGDIGSEGNIGVQDNVVNAVDFALMKQQLIIRKTCNAGENLEADLNGDCIVDTFDLQILKNAMGEQYSQKTF